MKICILIKKDIFFCPNWILIAMMLTFLAPAYFLYISDLNEIFLEPICLFSALLGCNIAVSRTCYIEDNYGTQKLLSAMPVTGTQLVLSRYLEGLFFTIFFILLVICNSYLFLGISLHSEFALAAIFGGLVFEGVYLLFYYKWGSNIAQYAFLGVVGLIGVTYLIVDKMNISVGNITIDIGGGILLLIGLGIYAISAFMSCQCYRSV